MGFLPKLKKGAKKEKFSLGIDIGSQVIKAVKAKINDAGFFEICDFSFEPTSIDPTDSLKKIREFQKIDCANISVCGTSTVIRYIDFPRMEQSELKQALKFEAQKHIPFSVDEVNLDGYILKEDLPNNRMLILVAAAKKDLSEQRIRLIQECGFTINSINIDSIALINAFNFNFKDDEDLKHKTVALLNVGASLSNLNILENIIPRLSRDIHVAGNKFTQKIQDTFGMDFRFAEELKINPDKDREKFSQLSEVLEPVYSNLAGAIRTSFDYYESQSASSVSKIYLSGGGSKFLGFKDALGNLIGIEVDFWDPLAKLKLADGIDKTRIKELSNQLPVAIGLSFS